MVHRAFRMLAGWNAAEWPFSHVVEAEGWLFVAGQVATDLGAPMPADIEGETREVMGNLERILGSVGSGLEEVASARVFLSRFEEDYEGMNRVYRSYFAEGRLPARTCIGVTRLANGARVEIDVIARRR